MWIVIIAGLAGGTLLFRLTGPTVGAWLEMSERTERLLTIAATVMLAAVVVTATLSAHQDTPASISVARVAGVGAGAILAWVRQPMYVVVIAAAGVTATFRFAGIA
ncbi:AzlD domain-containing protein [Arhodomonas sp. AD133]|uniref:AzlD domain-containing protein n=1 Tax=Arhodomonas sp. AD133 TaxID=3415009 RepID=UPI003EBEBDDF